MAVIILPSADNTDQIGQSTANGDASNLRWNAILNDCRVEGDLTVTGDTTTVSTTNTLIQDKLLELASGTTGDPAATDDKGIIIDRGDDPNAAIIWDEDAESFKIGTTASNGDATGAISVTTGTLVANLDSNSTLTEVKVATELNDSSGNELIVVTATGSAVNHIGIANAATTDSPTIQCLGTDNDVGLNIQLQGTGSLDVLSTDTAAAQLKLYEETGDGTNYVGLQASDITTSYTLKLPTAAPDTSGLSLVSTDAGVCSWSAVSAGGLSDGSVSLAKLDDLSELTVIGRTSAGDGVPEAMAVKDEDNMASDSAVALVTQQSVKAYVDAQTVSNSDWSGTDLAVANGGTGASDAAGARTSLGLVISTDVQAYDAQLSDVAGLAVSDGNFIVGDGSNFVAESGATARASLGLGSISTQAADSVAITGGSVTGITDITVTDGGTGASDAAGARTNLGLVISTDVQAYNAKLSDVAGLAVSDGNFIVGDGSNFVAESGATARASLGLGSISTQAADSVAITGGSVTGITDITIADGGTGASDAAGARTNLGLVISTDVQAYDAQLTDIASNLTATAAELNYNDITTLGTTQASKVVTTDSNGDIVDHAGNITITGAGHGLTINNGDLNVTGDGQITGSLQVNDKLNLSGSVATIGATTLKMDDSLIEINYAGADASATRDLGIIGRVEDAVADKYQGIIFDGSDDIWKFINTTTYPGADNYVSNTTDSTVQAGKVIVTGGFSAVPASAAGAAGDTQGTIIADASYIYVCTADYDTSDIWKRVAIATW